MNKFRIVQDGNGFYFVQRKSNRWRDDWKKCDPEYMEFPGNDGWDKCYGGFEYLAHARALRSRLEVEQQKEINSNKIIIIE